MSRRKPVWPYDPLGWTEFDEHRLNSAADALDQLANDISTQASTCCQQTKADLSSALITDAGAHFEEELDLWKQSIESDVVTNLRASAAAIRNTIKERMTLWDCFVEELRQWEILEREE